MSTNAEEGKDGVVNTSQGRAGWHRHGLRFFNSEVRGGEGEGESCKIVRFICKNAFFTYSLFLYQG